MQGKIALEEHFAIEPTLGDSQVFGAHVWNELGPRLLDVQDTRLGEMDKHGIEMMILSLNAPAVQAIHDVKRAIDGGAPGQRRARRGSAQAPRPLRRLCRAADAGSGSRHRRTHPLRQGARLCRRAGQWLLANRHAGQRDLLRSAAIPAVLARGRSARRAVLSAPAQSAAELEPDNTKAIPGCSGRTGRSRRKPRCTRCA